MSMRVNLGGLFKFTAGSPWAEKQAENAIKKQTQAAETFTGMGNSAYARYGATAPLVQNALVSGLSRPSAGTENWRRQARSDVMTAGTQVLENNKLNWANKGLGRSTGFDTSEQRIGRGIGEGLGRVDLDAQQQQEAQYWQYLAALNGWNQDQLQAAMAAYGQGNAAYGNTAQQWGNQAENANAPMNALLGFAGQVGMAYATGGMSAAGGMGGMGKGAASRTSPVGYGTYAAPGMAGMGSRPLTTPRTIWG